ncbi:MAG: YggS family pyridoxal phosphate-dependent enzyme [Pseudomonadota bacterium]
MSNTSVAENLAQTRERAAKASRDAGRNPNDTQLVAVSKRQDDNRIDQALAAGHRHFGENRVQEAIARWSHRRETYPDLVLHLIGPLQTNKVRDAVGLFDMIEVIDRPKLAKAVSSAITALDRRPRLLVQVNTGSEDQKSGVEPSHLGELLAYCREECGLEIDGLMCIPPIEDPPAPHFAFLAKLAREHGLPRVSMGMTGDFETAIHQGATEIRVGTAIFGPRPPQSSNG